MEQRKLTERWNFLPRALRVSFCVTGGFAGIFFGLLLFIFALTHDSFLAGVACITSICFGIFCFCLVDNQ